MAAFPPSVIAGQVIEPSHHNGLLDNVARKKTALEGQLFFTPGSILFADASGFVDEDNSNLFWNNTSKRLGIGDATPDALLDVETTTDQKTLIINMAKNDGGSAVVAEIIDDRGFSGVNSGTTFKVTTRDDSGDDTGAIVDFGTLAASKFRVGIDGKVGIGDSTPDALLDVESPLTDQKMLIINMAKNDGGSAILAEIIDDRGFSGVNSGTSFKVTTRDDSGDDTGAIVDFGTVLASKFRVGIDGNVGINIATAETRLHIGSTIAAVTLEESTVTPANPASGTQGRFYIKENKIIFQWNDAGTVRYKYLDLTGTGVTWVHTTTAP